MTLEKSFEWLFKRFQNQNIQTCDFDIKCLKNIAEWVNRGKEQEIMQNAIYAKLFCHVFIQEINFYKDFEFAQKGIATILEKTVEEHYQLFTQRINDFELNRYLTSLGIDVEKREFTESEDKEELKQANGDEFIKYASGYWSEDKIRKSLNNQITETINKYKNLP